MQTIAQATADLEAGRTTARKLVERCLEAIEKPDGEGSKTFLRVYAEEARASADAIDALRKVNRAPGKLAGIPISVKDLFDVAGETTAAGSKVLAEAQPAAEHATVVSRALAAGLILMGRTNMTEFAFSGIGANPHFGTPRSPWRRDEGRIPGGSSSGAAVSVADGMALAGLGTDTGGSCRIPAAFCGIVGYKPTARRVPITGVLPLAPSLDSVGPLANSVSCCAAIDAVLAGEAPRKVDKVELRGLRLAVPGNVVMDGVEPEVAEAFGRGLNRLGNLGVRITHLSFPQFEEVLEANKTGGFAVAEAYAWHRPHLAQHGEQYDPRVRVRMERGEKMTAADVIRLQQARRQICDSMDRATAAFDAVAMPTCPILPPRLDALADDKAYALANAMALRNTTLGNFLDRCAISLPANRPGEAPVGFMLMGETGGDRRLFALAAALEPILKE